MYSIYDKGISFVYADQDIETNELYVGFKSDKGSDKLTYISSCESSKYWSRRQEGKLERSILFIGSEIKAKVAEWFALDQGFKMGLPFFNSKNNAHRIDDSILSVPEKQIIIDFLRGEGKGIENGSVDASESQKNREIVMSIAGRIESRDGYYKEMLLPVSEVSKYERYQVREELVNYSTVSKLRQRLLENPKEAKEMFLPITVVVKRDGTKMVVNGNTRLATAIKTAGWDEVPVIFVNESEFGSTNKIRENNYRLFGLYMNREPLELRVYNSQKDLKRNVVNFLVEEKIDLSKPAHVDRARQLVYMNFGYVCGSKQQLNGVINSIICDFEKTQAELTYQENLISYSEGFLSIYCWDNYRSKDISAVYSRVSETANAKPLAYICRVMARERNKKGAIVLYYTSKQEIAKEQKDGWILDLIKTIEYMNLPIIVDVLPQFNK